MEWNNLSPFKSDKSPFPLSPQQFFVLKPLGNAWQRRYLQCEEGIWEALTAPEQLVWAELLYLCPTLLPHVLYSPPGSSVPRILQAKIVEWVAISFSRGSSQPRDWTCVSSLALADRFYTTSTTWEAWAAYLAPIGMRRVAWNRVSMLGGPDSCHKSQRPSRVKTGFLLPDGLMWDATAQPRLG